MTDQAELAVLYRMDEIATKGFHDFRYFFTPWE